MGNFTFEEMNLMCIYNTGSRTGLIDSLREMRGELAPEETELREQLYIAVMALPEKKAKRIYARYYLGMAVNEIAEVEGVDPSRVRDSIRRGLKQLVKYF